MQYTSWYLFLKFPSPLSCHSISWLFTFFLFFNQELILVWQVKMKHHNEPLVFTFRRLCDKLRVITGVLGCHSLYSPHLFQCVCVLRIDPKWQTGLCEIPTTWVCGADCCDIVCFSIVFTVLEINELQRTERSMTTNQLCTCHLSLIQELANSSIIFLILCIWGYIQLQYCLFSVVIIHLLMLILDRMVNRSFLLIKKDKAHRWSNRNFENSGMIMRNPCITIIKYFKYFHMNTTLQ